MNGKLDIISAVIGTEGDYSNHPSDKGKETMYGITEAVARKHGWQGPMKMLPRSLAIEIYGKEYWDKLCLDEIYRHSPILAANLVDLGVNAGTGSAGKYFQRTLNVMNGRQRYYQDITVDGNIGPSTMRAFKAYFNRRGEKGLVILNMAINCWQGVHYMLAAERREPNEDFAFGWMDRVTAEAHYI